MKSNLNKLTVVIPSYNRPTDLLKVINYWSDIENLKVIVLDGSEKSLDRDIIKKFKKKIKYLNLRGISQVRRIFLSKKFIKTKYTVMCPDDEIYSPIGLIECINHLEKNQTSSCCMGDLVFGFRRRKSGIVFLRMYKTYSSRLKIKSKVKIDRAIEFMTSKINRPCMYSVMRSKHYKNLTYFCSDLDKFNCLDIYEILFDIYLPYCGEVKVIRTFNWLRNKTDDNEIGNRFIRFHEFWNSKKNSHLKKNLLKKFTKLLKNKEDKKLEQLFDIEANNLKTNLRRKFKNTRDPIIKFLKNNVVPDWIYEPIQKKRQNELSIIQLNNYLRKNNYNINQDTINKIYKFTKYLI